MVGLPSAPRSGTADVSPWCPRYKSEKLMEHLKLFSTRINIPRLIRVCEEHHHWKELVFLYVQYDEYDNAVSGSGWFCDGVVACFSCGLLSD